MRRKRVEQTLGDQRVSRLNARPPVLFPARDLLVVTDESPELLAAMHPYPAIWGTPPMPDLTGVRRVYAVAPYPAALAPMFARFGPAPPFAREDRARRWDVAAQGLARVVYQATDALGTTLQARREGGAAEGPCPLMGDRLACNGEAYLHVVVAPLHFDGVEQRCVFAHPHEGGRVVIEVSNLPPARAIIASAGSEMLSDSLAAISARLARAPSASVPVVTVRVKPPGPCRAASTVKGSPRPVRRRWLPAHRAGTRA